MSHHKNDEKDPDYVAKGLKASIHNERVSGEAKESAAHRLQEMGKDVPEWSGSKGSTLNPNQQRGYKAALKNPHVSDKAKQHAQEVLEESGSLS